MALKWCSIDVEGGEDHSAVITSSEKQMVLNEN